MQTVANKPATVVRELRTMAEMMDVDTFGATQAMEERSGALEAALKPYCISRVGEDACNGVFAELTPVREVRGAVYEVRASPSIQTAYTRAPRP